MGIRKLNILSNVSRVTAADTEEELSVRRELEVTGTSLGWELQLPFAAKKLDISADPKDYMLYVVPIMYSDLPNRNGFGFPLQELIRWNVELGCQAYKGWAGMPMYQEHKSEDHKKACGIVIDTSLRRIAGLGRGKFWKLLGLAAIDRSKYSELTKRLDAKELGSFSMGAMVNYCTCSYCGAEAGKCSHVPESNEQTCLYELNGQLVFKNVHVVKPYELSVVADPAFGTAYSDQPWGYS